MAEKLNKRSLRREAIYDEIEKMLDQFLQNPY
jgi:hypothetical protein